MHHDDVPIGADAVARLVAEQFPQCAGQAVQPLPNVGTDNRIFRLGAGHVARFPRRSQSVETSAAALRGEAAAMAELAGVCPVATPLPVGVGQPGHGYPMCWGLQTWVPGTVATPGGLSGSLTFAHALAGLVRELRRADTMGRPFSGSGRGGALQEHDGWVAICLDKSTSVLDVACLHNMWAQFRRLPPAATPVMSHKDLIPANILVQGDQIVGLLDGGGFGPADPALDLVAGWHLLEMPARDLFHDQLHCNDVTRQRGAAWAFVQALGLVWYYQLTHPEMAALGRSTLDRLMAAFGRAG